MNEGTRLEQLTGLRFFAALGVLVCHAELLAPDLAPKFLFALGGHGVTLFFVLSGFVLTWRYDQPSGEVRRRGEARNLDLRRFAAARFARIAPLYWLALALTALAYASLGTQISLGPPPQSDAQWGTGLAINALALQAWIPSVSVQQFWNAPGWSISAEFFFYACFPWLLTRRFLSGTVGSFFGVITIFALMLGVYLALLWLTETWGAVGLSFATRLPVLGLLPFLLGVLGCRLLRRQAHLHTHQGGWTALALILLVSAGWLAGRWSDGPEGLLVLVLAAQLVYAPLFCFLVVSLALDEGPLGRLLSSAPMIRLGDASYALYLLHWLPIGVALSVMEPGSTAPLWSLAIAAVGLLAVSLLVHAWFETPVRLKLVSVLGQPARMRRVV